MMKQMLKRTGALLLSLCLTLSVFCGVVTPLPVAAAGEAAAVVNTNLEYGTSGGITRGAWLHDLAVIFDLSVDEENMPDPYYSDLTEDTLYYQDIMAAIEAGMVFVDPGDLLRPQEYVTRDFAAQTLNMALGIQPEQAYTFSDSALCSDPDSAQALVEQGWLALVGGKFAPEQKITKAEVTALLNGAQARLAAGEIDTTHQNSYTFAPGVVAFPEDARVEIGEDNTVTIYGDARGLKQGNTFVVFSYGVPVAYLAKSVTASGGTVTVVAEKADTSAAILSADAAGEEEIDLSDFEGADDFRTVYVENSAMARSIAQTYGLEVKRGSVLATKEFQLANGLKVNFSCVLSDLKLQQKSDDKSGNYVMAVTGNYSISSTVSLNVVSALGGSSSITLGSVSLAGIGRVTISLQLALDGRLTYTYNGSFKVGLQRTSSGVSLIHSFPKKSFSGDVEVKALVGVRAEFSVDIFFASGRVYAETGIKGNYTEKRYNDGRAPNVCADLHVWWFTNAGASGKIGIGIFSKSASISKEIFGERNSPVQLCFHWDDGKRVYNCPRGNCRYYTPIDSRYGDSSYAGGSSSGIGRNGLPFTRYTYTLNDKNEATITKYQGNVSALNIPATLDGYTVVAIGNSVFSGNKLLQAVSIPDTVTSIGSNAFLDCSNLATVKLSNSLTSMGDFCFGNCTALNHITIPKSMGQGSCNYNGPFTGCTGLSDVTLEQGITAIPGYLFKSCPGFTTIQIPDSVTEIGGSAFEGCTSLSMIKIPDSVTAMENGIFSGCTALKDVTLPASRQNIAQSMFENCSSLETIRLPKTVTTIRSYAFKNCTLLKNITWSDAPVTIESEAFYGCTSLSDPKIPATVTTIGARAFYNCDGLTTMRLPDSVRSIGDRIFYDCDNLTDITLGSSTEKIPASAFEHCDALQKLVVPYHVTGIGDNAFKDCTKFTEITIPRATSSISSTAFSYPSKMTIYGVSGTYAETYAKNNGIRFVNREVPATKVTLSQNALTLNNGASAALVMTVTPADFTDEVTWKSNHTDVATVDSFGVVKAVAPGTATIQVNVGNVSASCMVTVKQGVTRISLNRTSLSLDALNTFQLTAAFIPTMRAIPRSLGHPIIPILPL